MDIINLHIFLFFHIEFRNSRTILNFFLEPIWSQFLTLESQGKFFYYYYDVKHLLYKNRGSRVKNKKVETPIFFQNGPRITKFDMETQKNV